VLEGFGSKCCRNFEGSTYSFTVLFWTIDVKVNFKYSSKYLRFMSMVGIDMKVSSCYCG